MKTERDEKKEFFVKCEKCGTKVFEHRGYMESPPGNFIFSVKCPICGDEFNHIMMTEKARLKRQQELMLKSLNPDVIKKMAEKVMGGSNGKI